jgi:arsenate reductase
MDTSAAQTAFQALGQISRIEVFRLLVQAGPEGLAAGDIARQLDLRQNTLSSQLAQLQAAGLIVPARDGRSIRYSANMTSLRALVGWLLEDCCGGDATLCAPVLDSIVCTCERPAMSRSFNVLFLCTGNSARSILGEGILNHVGAGRFRAYSAGSRPGGAPNPFALDLLRREGIDTGFARSKSWDEFAGPEAPKMDFVFTVCDSAAAEECPFWPGQPVTAHWGLPDPAAVEGSDAQKALAFAETYRALSRRIAAFTALPLDSLDRMSLQSRLKQIGNE